ncbi:MAG: hypothetical protein KKD64_09855 [Alphaproteobacteria bacterium]|nr:hypothetical protein [Alphaproteobacteria bacterium]
MGEAILSSEDCIDPSDQKLIFPIAVNNRRANGLTGPAKQPPEKMTKRFLNPVREVECRCI